MAGRKKSKVLPIFIILIIIVLAVVLAVTAISKPYVNDKNGVKQSDKEVSYEVSPEDYSGDVATDLEENGVVKSASYFKRWLSKEHSDYSFKAGIYTLNANMSYDELITAFDNPTVDRSVVSVCIPEGKRVVDIAAAMEENGICSADDFIKSQNSDEFDFDFVKNLENVKNRGYRLEGYLFPATYDLQKNSKAHDVVYDMLLAFSYRLSSNGWQEKCDKMGISLDDAITMGSILEAEASSASEEDKQLVSSVFWNRINSPAFSMLQSDPTVFYADLLEEKGFSRSLWKGYTTYSCKGLPTGAINCPGEATVNAALSPAKTDYYYFFTYDDSDGKMVYVYANEYSEFESLAKKYGVL